MIEKQIDIDKYFKYDLASLKQDLKNTNLCKIVTDNEVDESYQLMYACEDEQMYKLTNIVAHKLTDFYINRYKKFYLQKHINLTTIDKIFVPAYICAISSFDNFTDREIALDANYSNKKIVVLPFLYFKLTDLIERWRTIISLTNDNIECFDKKSGIIDLLCYLIRNQQNKTQNLELNFIGHGIKVFNGEILTFESQTQTKNDIANMKAVLVKLCPQTLTINYDNNNSHIETIKRIFSEKVI